MSKIIDNIKEKATDLKDRAVVFYTENAYWLLPLGIGTAAAALKTGMKLVKTHKERQTKENYCYDPTLGHYWKLRRPLSNDEWLEIDRRRANGERYADILESMKVLK